jgi:hypothetical protein
MSGFRPAKRDETEERTPPHAFPIIFGHQVVGSVAALSFRTAAAVKWSQRPDSPRSGKKSVAAQASSISNDFLALPSYQWLIMPEL